MKHLILVEGGDERAVAPLLQALGVTFRPSTSESVAQGAHRNSTNAVVVSENHLIRLARAADDANVSLRELLGGFKQVLIWPFRGTPDGLHALSGVTGCRIQALAIHAPENIDVVGPPTMCGPFAYLTIPAAAREAHPLRIVQAGCAYDWFATVGGAGLFGRFTKCDTEIFVNATTAVFDPAVEYRKNLQASECFPGLVPLLWFLQHAKISMPRSAYQWANWIIDDPNLVPHYGFFRPLDVVRAMARVDAAATVAFIPWNYRRCSADVMRKIRDAWPHAAICVHGCNHTQAEFSTKTTAKAHQLGTLAMERMRQMEAENGLRFERVMVFPQGKFSASAMMALRQLNLSGIVNTELADNETGRGVNGAEILQPAVMAYSGLPLFLRRPPEEPLSNFALDLQLGKPCLIVTHHDYFRRGMEPMLEKIRELNRLEPTLTWTSLGNGISETTAIQHSSSADADVSLLSPRSRVRVPQECRRIVFTKREPLVDNAPRVTVNGRAVVFERCGDHISFVAANVSDVITVEVTLPGPPSSVLIRLRLPDRAKIAARRYFSEFRDNYVQRSRTLKAGVKVLNRIAGTHA